MQPPGFRFYSIMFILLALSVLLAISLKTCDRGNRERQESSELVSHPTATIPMFTPVPTPTPQLTATPTPTTTPTSLPTVPPTLIPRSTPASGIGRTISPTLTPTPVSTSASSTAIYSCTLRKTCTEMSSCEEAYYYLNICGNKRLDRDNDGVPCENICPDG